MLRDGERINAKQSRRPKPLSAWKRRESDSDGPKRLDRYLQRAAWIAQIALVVGGIAGYFYTVRPIHQKQRLDEQIAELKGQQLRLQKENGALKMDAYEYYLLRADQFGVDIFIEQNSCGATSTIRHTDPDKIASGLVAKLNDIRLQNFREIHRQTLSAALTEEVPKLRAAVVDAQQAALRRLQRLNGGNESVMEVEYRQTLGNVCHVAARVAVGKWWTAIRSEPAPTPVGS